MFEDNKKHDDIHLNKEVTRLVHKHRVVAKWLMRILVMGFAIVSYYLKKEQKHIEDEDNKK